MKRVQVVYASRHGATAGIAERIAEVLRSAGAEVTLADATNQPDAQGFDAHVIGSGVQLGSWFTEGTEFLERNQATLAAKPVWMFSSGPLQSASTTNEPIDRIELALGPADGPGSGGRKKIEALSAAIHPREHRVFYGAYDPKDPPRSMQERLVRFAARRALPAGDFREWDAIEAWASQIAAELVTPVPVG